VREALKVLELAGLLVVRRGYNGGTFVAPPDFEEASESITLTFRLGETTIDQLIEAALAIEVRAAELTAQNASDLEIDDLQEIIQRTEQSLNFPARYLTALIDFHMAVTELSHNTVFILALNAMRSLLMQELNRLISDQKLCNTFVTHQQEIVKAITEQDAQRAGQANRHDSWPCLLGPVVHSPPFPFAGLSTLLFPSLARVFPNFVGTTDKVYQPYRSKEEAGAIARSMLLVLPSGATSPRRQAGPGPPLRADSSGAAAPENSSQLGMDEFFNDPMLPRLTGQALAGNRKLKTLE